MSVLQNISKNKFRKTLAVNLKFIFRTETASLYNLEINVLNSRNFEENLKCIFKVFYLEDLCKHLIGRKHFYGKTCIHIIEVVVCRKQLETTLLARFQYQTDFCSLLTIIIHTLLTKFIVKNTCNFLQKHVFHTPNT